MEALLQEYIRDHVKKQENIICIKNMQGISIIDGVFIDAIIHNTSSQFLFESGIITARGTIKYMFILVSSLFNLVSQDIDLKFFNTFKTVFEIDSGIFKYFLKARKAFPLILAKRLRLRYPDLFFKVKECMYISKHNITYVTFGLEMNKPKRTQKILDTLPNLLTIVKVTFYNLTKFLNSVSLNADIIFAIKKTLYYKSLFYFFLGGFKMKLRNYYYKEKEFSTYKEVFKTILTNICTIVPQRLKILAQALYKLGTRIIYHPRTRTADVKQPILGICKTKNYVIGKSIGMANRLAFFFSTDVPDDSEDSDDFDPDDYDPEYSNRHAPARVYDTPDLLNSFLFATLEKLVGCFYGPKPISFLLPLNSSTLQTELKFYYRLFKRLIDIYIRQDFTIDLKVFAKVLKKEFRVSMNLTAIEYFLYNTELFYKYSTDTTSNYIFVKFFCYPFYNRLVPDVIDEEFSDDLRFRFAYAYGHHAIKFIEKFLQALRAS